MYEHSSLPCQTAFRTHQMHTDFRIESLDGWGQNPADRPILQCRLYNSQAQWVRSSLFSVNHASVYLFSMRKKSCVLSEQVPFVLKRDDVIVTSPSWLPNHLPRHSTGNKQYPSAATATKHWKASKTDSKEGFYVTIQGIFVVSDRKNREEFRFHVPRPVLTKWLRVAEGKQKAYKILNTAQEKKQVWYVQLKRYVKQTDGRTDNISVAIPRSALCLLYTSPSPRD